jgi:hypothetical protein
MEQANKLKMKKQFAQIPIANRGTLASGMVQLSNLNRMRSGGNKFYLKCMVQIDNKLK